MPYLRFDIASDTLKTPIELAELMLICEVPARIGKVLCLHVYLGFLLNAMKHLLN